MPALPPNGNSQDDSDIQVLVTGFGAFKNFLNNPSWLAVKPLHDLYLDTSHPPDMHSFPSNSSSLPQPPSSSSSPRRIYIQTLQLAVAYQPLLDTVPRLHSSLPTSPHAKPWLDPNNDQDGSSGDGQSYPQGYSRMNHPPKGYDIILNVGVGLKGELAIETRGHKKGYRLKDSMGLKAPPFRDQNQDHGFDRSKETESEKAERLRMELERDIDSALRGFDEGYEEFQDEEVTHIEADKLLEFLKSRNVPTRKSEDAGRFLCDFLCYSSMCESRRFDPAKTKRAKTLFIHIPPPGEDLTTEQASEAIKAIVWFMVCVDKGGIL